MGQIATTKTHQFNIMAVITLVRHGQASFGAQNYDQLSDLGYKQAAALGEFFKQRGYQFQRIICGKMQRHMQTYDSFYATFAADATCGASVEKMANYNEFDHEQVLMVAAKVSTKAELMRLIGSQPNPKAYLAEVFQNAVARWQSGQFDAQYSESWQQFKDRCALAFEQTAAIVDAQNSNILVFSSGGVISCIVGALLNLSDRQIFGINANMSNAAITKIKVNSSGNSLLTLSEHSYLENAKDSLLSWY